MYAQQNDAGKYGMGDWDSELEKRSFEMQSSHLVEYFTVCVILKLILVSRCMDLPRPVHSS